MTTALTTDKTLVTKYIESIRNKDKKSYAKAYLAYCLGRRVNPFNEFSISFMAKQSVRMSLEDLGFTGK